MYLYIIILIVLIICIFFLYKNLNINETFINDYLINRKRYSNFSHYNINKLNIKSFNIKNVQNYNIIRVETNIYKLFIDNILPKLNTYIILIIGDNDTSSCCYSVNNYKNFVNNKQLLHIYCENWNDTLYSKLTLLPIGFESKMISHKLYNENNFLNICKNIKNPNKKLIKILNNSSCIKYKNPKSGSYNQRQEVENKLKNNKLVDFICEERIKTWKMHNNYSFEICAEGNGIDTHRFYEALYLNTIPIVKKNSLSSLYENFDCIIVNDWKEISYKNCKKWLQKYKKINKKKLYLNYWVPFKLNYTKKQFNILHNLLNNSKHIYQIGINNLIYLISIYNTIKKYVCLESDKNKIKLFTNQINIENKIKNKIITIKPNNKENISNFNLDIDLIILTTMSKIKIKKLKKYNCKIINIYKNKIFII